MTAVRVGRCQMAMRTAWTTSWQSCGLIAIGALSVEAADTELHLVDKNCWIEVFDDSKYDADEHMSNFKAPKRTLL